MVPSVDQLLDLHDEECLFFLLSISLFLPRRSFLTDYAGMIDMMSGLETTCQGKWIR